MESRLVLGVEVAGVVTALLGGFVVYQMQRSLINLQDVALVRAGLETYGYASADPFRGFNNTIADMRRLRAVGDLSPADVNYSVEVRPGRVVSSPVLKLTNLPKNDCMSLASHLAFEDVRINGTPVEASYKEKSEACNGIFDFKGRNTVELRTR